MVVLDDGDLQAHDVPLNLRRSLVHARRTSRARGDRQALPGSPGGRNLCPTMRVPSDDPGSSLTRRNAGIAIADAAAAWVVALALPNLRALPVWPWTPGLWTATGGEDGTAFGLHDAIRALASSLVVSVVALAAVGRFGWFAIATLPLVLLAPIEAWCVVEYGQPSTAHVLGVLAETNAEEAAEFHGGHDGARGGREDSTRRADDRHADETEQTDPELAEREELEKARGVAIGQRTAGGRAEAQAAHERGHDDRDRLDVDAIRREQ